MWLAIGYLQYKNSHHHPTDKHGILCGVRCSGRLLIVEVVEADPFPM